MADMLLVANDSLLLHRLEPLVDRMKAEGRTITTAERETRASTGPPGEDFIRDILLVISSAVFTKEYDHIKQWFREWFVDLPKPKDGRTRRDLWVRVEDEARRTLARFTLRDEADD